MRTYKEIVKNYILIYKHIAREALRGKWLIAVVVGLVASLLGGAGADGPELKLDIADPADEIIALAVVLTIDAVTESKGGVSVSVSSN